MDAELAGAALFRLPQLATPAARPPADPDWGHEIKLDGYRLQIAKAGAAVRLFTRQGEDWTRRLPELAADAAHWPDGALDGELCVAEGARRDFAALQSALAAGDTGGLIFHAFDLLVSDADDQRGLAYGVRKARLADHLGRIPVFAAGRIRYVAYSIGAGPAVFQAAVARGMEGVVSKRLAAPYRGGRTPQWLKSKGPRGDKTAPQPPQPPHPAPRPRTPEDGQRVVTPENGRPITTRED